MLVKIYTTLCILLLPFLTFAKVNGPNLDKSSSDTTTVPVVIKETRGFSNQILTAIEAAQKQHNYGGTGIIITRTNSSNAFKLITELEVLLKSKGYSLLAQGGVSMPMKGFKIVRHVNCYEIIIGTI